MFELDNWQEIIDTIRKNKLRTFLTAFSVAWGIFLLVILIGAGTGLKNGAEYQFRDDAINSIWINPGKTSLPYQGMNPGRVIQLRNNDLESIQQQIKQVEYSTARYYLSGQYTVRYKNKYSSFQVRACHPDHQYIENTIIVKGRFLNDLDLKEKRKVTAIGTKIVETLFDENEDPIGKWIDVNGIKYQVVGVYNDIGSEHELLNVYIPISTAQMVYGGGDKVTLIIFTIGNATISESKTIADKVLEIMSENHRFDPNDKRAVRIRNRVEQFEKIKNLFRGINIFLWIVSFGTIVAGMVGVSNIMLIVAKERTREIGIRKALGATPNSIISLFLQESISITVLAGYIGLILGMGVIEIIKFGLNQMQEQPDFFRNPDTDLSTALIATLLLVIVGTLAGYFPARKAASVNPIYALKDE